MAISSTGHPWTFHGRRRRARAKRRLERSVDMPSRRVGALAAIGLADLAFGQGLAHMKNGWFSSWYPLTRALVRSAIHVL